MADTTGQADLRAENVERIVKGFALMEYRLKEVVMTPSSNSWIESYYQETATELTAGATCAIKGVARLAKFPFGEVSWTKQSAYLLKHGLEGVIAWEDAISNNVDVIARTLLRIARAVAKSVDTEIWDAITENRTVVNINQVTISSGNEWDSATVANRDPVQNILNAKREIYTQNYDPDNGFGFLVLSPKDYANFIGNAKVLQNPTYKANDIVANGKVGRLLNLDIIVSNVVTADYALVGVAKECATWKTASPLTIATIKDEGVSYTIRAWEIGVTQLTNPKAVCLISNTQA